MRVQCTECEWIGENDAALLVPHPFLPGKTLEGCPQCREANVLLAWSEPEPPQTTAENIAMLVGEIGRIVELIEVLDQEEREARELAVDRGLI